MQFRKSVTCKRFNELTVLSLRLNQHFLVQLASFEQVLAFTNPKGVDFGCCFTSLLLANLLEAGCDSQLFADDFLLVGLVLLRFQILKLLRHHADFAQRQGLIT